MTVKTYQLPMKLVVFDNGRLGMVTLEQEQGGLPEFGTELDDPDFIAVATALGLTGIRVTDPADLHDSVRRALGTPGPVLLDVLTNPVEPRRLTGSTVPCPRPVKGDGVTHRLCG